MRYQIENGTVSLGGKTVLDHIDFSVKGREKIAVVGRNGAGKTTLLRLISGELSLDRDDKNFGKGIKTDRELSIGFLHQQSFQDVEKTVEQEIISLINEEDIFSRERYYFEKEYDRIFTGFGFQKEDVYEKMQQLNKMYQSRAQQMRDQNRGQLKQMRKQQQEELEDMKARLAAERAEEQQKLAEEQQAMKEKFDAEQKEAYEKMQEQIAAARIEIRREMQAQMDEKTAQQKRELTMISEELERLNERFLLLKTRIVELAEQE